MLAQSRRALEYLPPDNLYTRATVTWTMGVAYNYQGDRPAARRALTEAIALSQAAGDIFTTILATITLGNVTRVENQLYLAMETYQRVLELAGDQPLQFINEAHLGIAHILYEWNDLEAAEQHGRQSLHLARQYDTVIDRFIVCEIFLARLKLAQGDVAGASAVLAQADQAARERNFVHRIPEVADAQVLTLLRQGELAAAAQLAQTHDLPASRARVYLAEGNTSAALSILEPLREQAAAHNWQDEQLKVMVLEAVALHLHGAEDQAVQLLENALVLAEPGGFIRLFVDEGLPMKHLLREAASRGVAPEYTRRLLAAFSSAGAKQPAQATGVEALSERELEVLRLIADGLSNREIGERLFLALSTVKGHSRIIFDKLQVQRRTEAVARARELGLL
jgi:LuxR family maltose regulon positive regulatory protein